MATDPKARARDAFADLPTPEKTAFVIEATFSTIGAALRETGERLGAIITEFDPDEFFRADPEPEVSTPPPAAKRAAAKKPAATKTTATKTTATKSASAKKPSAKKATTKKTTGSKASGKTAGRKKKDDDA